MSSKSITQKDYKILQLSSRYLATRFISSVTLKKEFISDVGLKPKTRSLKRRNPRCISGIESLILLDTLSKILLNIFTSVAAAYIFMWLRDGKKKEIKTVIDDFYDKGTKEGIEDYRKSINQMKKIKKDARSQRIILHHENTLNKLDDPETAKKLIKKYISDFDILRAKDVEDYLNKYKK